MPGSDNLTILDSQIQQLELVSGQPQQGHAFLNIGSMVTQTLAIFSDVKLCFCISSIDLPQIST